MTIEANQQQPQHDIESQSLTVEQKELIATQTRLYASQLSMDIFAKLKTANETSMQHPKVQEILQLNNFTKYSLLNKAMQWRNNIIDQQDRPVSDKHTYKQILLAKSILSLALRNIGESKLANEIGFSGNNAKIFTESAKNGQLKNHIFSLSYIKCLHAFQQSTQQQGGEVVAQRSKVDAILGYKTIQQLLSYANMKVSKPVVTEKEYTREYNALGFDYSDPVVLTQHIELIQHNNPTDQLDMSQSQKILGQLFAMSANTNGELVDKVINPYRQQLINHMLQISAGSGLLSKQTITNINHSVDGSLQQLDIDAIAKQYRQTYLTKKRKSKDIISQDKQQNPYLDSPYNPRKHINEDWTKWGDALFNKGFDISKKDEEILYSQKRGDQMFKEGIVYVVAKEGILNVPDDILMLVQDVLSLTQAGLEGDGLLLKYIGARRNADSNPVAAQDLAWLTEAHPVLGLCSAISLTTLSSIARQIGTLISGDGTAKNRGDMINMFGGLLAGGGGILKFGGKAVKMGGRVVRSEKIIKAGEHLDQFGKKVINKATIADPVGAVTAGIGAGVSKLGDFVKPKVQAVRRAGRAAMSELNPSKLKPGNVDTNPTNTVDVSDSSIFIETTPKPSTNSVASKPESPSTIRDFSNTKIQKLRTSISDSPGKKLSTANNNLLAQYVDDLDMRIQNGLTTQEISTEYNKVYQLFNKLHPEDTKSLASNIDRFHLLIEKEFNVMLHQTLSYEELRLLVSSGLSDLDSTQKAVKYMSTLGKISDSRWGFEGLMGGVPAWLVRQIPGINMLPVEAATNLGYGFIQRRYALKIGMSDSQIRTMMLNQAKDAGISMTLSGVVALTGSGFLGGLNPLNWILSAGFGLGDFHYKANVKNAQEFIKFYGDQIEDLKKAGATPEQLTLHQAKYNELVHDLPDKVKEYKNKTQIYNEIAKAKNMNHLQMIIADRFSKGVQLESGYLMPKKTLIALIIQYEKGTLQDINQLPQEFGIRSQIIKLNTKPTRQPQTTH